jgi:hypothetical protein
VKAARLDLVVTHPTSTSRVYSSDDLTKTSENLRHQPKAGKRECEAWCIAHSSVSPTGMRKDGETKYLREDIFSLLVKILKDRRQREYGRNKKGRVGGELFTVVGATLRIV